jgi:hypothetical protein
MVLKRELAAYARRRPELLRYSRGLVVLIKDDDLIGVCGDMEAAFQDGVRRFGLAPFLVKQVLDPEPIARL